MDISVDEVQVKRLLRRSRLTWLDMLEGEKVLRFEVLEEVDERAARAAGCGSHVVDDVACRKTPVARWCRAPRSRFARPAKLSMVNCRSENSPAEILLHCQSSIQYLVLRVLVL